MKIKLERNLSALNKIFGPLSRNKICMLNKI